MKRIAAVLPLLLLALLAIASPAHARPTLGIGDQSPAMYDDPRFQALGVRHTRVVVPFDLMSDPVQFGRFAPILDAARSHDVEVLVAFNHRVDSHTFLPSVKAYTRGFKAFRKRFPWVRHVSPWNEANHRTQPTHDNPRAAARFYNAVRANCSGCVIVAADVLDQSGFERWIKTFRRHAKAPKIWGLHNYQDVNRMRDRSVARMRKATGRGRIWLTETGGIVRFARSWAYDERRAARATRHVLGVARRHRLERIYLYRWTGEPLGSRWDSGLIAPDGRPRPALNVVEAHLRRPLTKLPPIPRIPRFPTAPRA